MFFKANIWSMCLKRFELWWYEHIYVIVQTHCEIKVHICYYPYIFFGL